ncbi:beta-ketoacyl synthase N-terminal-like domain-containing protein [Actinosynnema sp. NPDC020468]|uniref:beta-ketoacyl synthase N-terminal-like domain-containing protein n=1 Tax=Actinosynnema sp. NPDC020468 TaxID=3154488 RepID=UPI00340F79C5
MARLFEPIAIVASECLLPGAVDRAAFWRVLDEGRTAIAPAPETWLDRSIYHSTDPHAVNRGDSDTVALLPEWEFSTPPRLPPKQLSGMDLAHRLALELGHRVVGPLDEAGVLPKETTGVWVANVAGTLGTQLAMVAYHASEEWSRKAGELRPDLADEIDFFNRGFQERFPHLREDAAVNGNILAGRIANYFDLRGPQMAVDANCASSPAALRAACLSLRDGTCDMALVAAIGVQAAEMTVVSSKARASAPGPSFPFDADARGYVPGEGAVMVALVRAEDAVAKGMPVLGVIRSIGRSSNGRGTAPWSPSQRAEELAITRAWEEGEFTPGEQIDYIEAHGTATQVGDRTEHAAMLATYGAAGHRDAIPFGSAKSVVGHTIEVAGMVGLLRALYVFDRGRVPPSVGVATPAAFVTEHADRLRLATRTEELAPGPRRVAVSSFGVGGVNYHMIIESEVEARPAPAAPRREPVAITGMAAIMPDANDVPGVWEHLRRSTAVRGQLAGYLREFERFYSRDSSHRDRTTCPVSSIVDKPVLAEPARWRILPKVASEMFDDHLLLLNAVSQLVAGDVVPEDPAVRARSGVFVTDILDGDGRNRLIRDLMFQRWQEELTRHVGDPSLAAEVFADPGLGLGAVTENASVAGQGVLGASRVAGGLDLLGAAVSVNSACASGLAALSLAIQELRAGGLDFAVVGGASLGVDVTNQVALSAIGSLSASGEGRPYDRAADGFVIGSGAAVFTLKRLSDAERDGDEILAVIRECVGNSDGKGRSMLAPQLRGRREVVRRAYALAGLDPSTVQYVEGHGAGNALGDSSELQVIAEEMATAGREVALGSVKGNYGHLKAAAGFAGLLKVVLCLRNRTMVATPGFTSPGDLGASLADQVRILDRAVEWPANGGSPRRAGLNSFGLGGTNFHAIVDEYVPTTSGRADEPAADSPGFAAESAADLADRLDLGTAGGTGPWRAAVFAPTSKVARAQRAVLASRLRAAGRRVAEVTESAVWAGPAVRTGPVVALFPGQAGTKDFAAVSWLARNGGADELAVLPEVLGEPGRIIAGALESGDPADLGDLATRSGTSQVLGLLSAHLVWRWFRPDDAVLLGHSAGEFGALVAAGVLRFADALRACWARGEFAEEAVDGRAGLMAAVFAGPDTVARLVDAVPGAHLGTVNGPAFCVVSGWADAIERVIAAAAAERIDCTRLDVHLPFHTPLLAAAVPRLREMLDGIEVSPPAFPVHSAALNGLYPADPEVIRTALAALYTEPVRLDQLIRRAAGSSRRFVECGAGRSLSRSVDAVLGDEPHLALPGVTSARGGLSRLADGLWVAGLEPARAEPADFALFTPVPVAAVPYTGTSWSGVPVRVAGPDRALAAEVADALRAAGAEVRSEADWLVWVAAEQAEEGVPGAEATMAELVHLRAVTAELATGWGARAPGGLLVVTTVDGRLGSSRSLLDPAGGALTGFTRALGQEYPQAATAVFDVGPDARPAAARRIVELGRPPAGHHEFGVDARDWWRTELAPVPPNRVVGPGLLDALREPDAAVVVSGGTTGIVAEMVCAAARRLTDPKGLLVLLSRTPAAERTEEECLRALAEDRKTDHLLAWRRGNPGRSLHEFEREWRRGRRALEAGVTLARLARAGVRVAHELVDVCDVAGMRALRERLRDKVVRTVVHGAGVERSSRITDKPAREWEDTVAVKVLGCQTLIDLAGEGLRLFVAHGSVSGAVGLPGQTDYSCANEYLAKATARLRARRPGVVAQYVGWPAWNRVGMAADPETRRRLEGRGFRYLDPDAGVRWSAEIVAAAPTLASHVVLLPVPLPALARRWTSTPTPPGERWWLVDATTASGATTTVHRLYDAADPRDADLAGHRVRGGVRIAAVQLVEQLAEAVLAATGVVPERLELHDVVFHQGLVLGRSGRRPTRVVVTGDQLRLETTPVLRGDLPGPGSVLVATASWTAGTGRDEVDLAALRRVGGGPDVVAEAARFGIDYTGRFATRLHVEAHPDFAAAGRFTCEEPAFRAGGRIIDPPELDTALRAVFAARSDSTDQGLPAAFGTVVLHPGRTPGEKHVFVSVADTGGYDLKMTDARGRVLVSVEGLRLKVPAEWGPR